MLTETTDTQPAEQIPGQADALELVADGEPTITLPVRILVLQRGWVVIGHYHELVDQAGDPVEVILNGAQVIRRWGTKRGLGELVDGPKENTVLDPAGVVRVHPLAVVLQVQANGQAWQDHLK